MHIEVELKARVSCPEGIRALLQKRFGNAHTVYRRDQYFASMQDPYDSIRLRQEDTLSFVTYKDRHCETGIEKNIEIEFQVDNAQAFTQFLHRLGYRSSFSKEKRVEAFQAGPQEPLYELVYVPPLGWFIEIERLIDDSAMQPQAQEQILCALHSLGLNDCDIEHRSYKTLLKEHGAIA